MYNITYIYIYVQRGLASCSPWGHKESDTTGWPNNKNIYVYTYIAFSVELLLNGRHDITLLLSSPGNNDILKKIIIKTTLIMLCVYVFTQSLGLYVCVCERECVCYCL